MYSRIPLHMFHVSFVSEFLSVSIYIFQWSKTQYVIYNVYIICAHSFIELFIKYKWNYVKYNVKLNDNCSHILHKHFFSIRTLEIYKKRVWKESTWSLNLPLLGFILQMYKMECKHRSVFIKTFYLCIEQY